MGFTIDMTQAANRQLDAANALDGNQKQPVAAYLYGLAAECAVKAMLKRLGVQEPKERTGPYYAHYPDLRGELLPELTGRGASVLEPFTKDGFLQDWDIVVRYARSDELVGSLHGRDARYLRWKKDAKQAVSKMQEIA